MINRLISGSVMAARFQSAPNPLPGLQDAATVSPTKRPPFTAATAGPKAAGWLVGLVQVLELTINRIATAIVASGPEVSRERRQRTFQREETPRAEEAEDVEDGIYSHSGV